MSEKKGNTGGTKKGSGSSGTQKSGQGSSSGSGGNKRFGEKSTDKIQTQNVKKEKG